MAERQMSPESQGGGGFDITKWTNPINAGIQTFNNLMGGGGQPYQYQFQGPGAGYGPQQMNQSGTSTVSFADPGQMELDLRDLLFGITQQTADFAQGGGPAGLTLEDILGGQLDPETSARLDDQAFSGFDYALDQALGKGRAMASLSGLPGSSQQTEQEAFFANPLMAEAGALRASLERDELARRMGLRQTMMGNLMAIQQSPLLGMLLQERLAAPTTTTDMEKSTEEIGALPPEAMAKIEQMVSQMPDFMQEQIRQQLLAQATAGWNAQSRDARADVVGGL